ncbi:MAG: antirestriction protein ArdA [Acidobacteria bacterium]|nr:antirestriction protein ArdA [Acidobacteriota bacterium]
MERDPHPPEGGEHLNDTPETPAEPIFEQLNDEQRIQRGIADALNEERPIDDATARRIAEQLHEEHESLLSTLAASGALPDGLERELLESVQDLPPETDSWIDALLDRAEWAGTSAEPQGDAAAQEAAAGPRDRDQERFDWFGGAAVGEDDVESLVADVPAPEHETTPRPAPRIYVADLAAYNNSRLHGVWLDATRDVEELWADIQAMLASSPEPLAEEFAIHDHEDFTGYPLGEHESLEFVSRLAKGIAEHGQAFAAYADWNRQADPELERFGEHYEGIYPTREAWAEEVANEVCEWPRYRQAIPEPLRGHVTLDLTSLALELEQYRHVVEGDEGVYVFNPDA